MKLIINKELSINKIKMMMSTFLVFALLMSGCASTTKSTFLGFGVGTSIGAANGALIGKRDSGQAILTSAIFMGVVGGLVGYFGHDLLEDRDADVRKETLFNLEKYGVSGFSNNVRPLLKEGKNE